MKLFSVMQTAFDNFDDTVRKYLARVFNSLGMNGNNTQVFGIIFNGIKGVMQNAMFYIEDALTEQNIFTATRKKSIYSLAKISGYEPFYGSSASGTLIGSIVRGSALDSDATKIFISNNTKIVNKETGIKYLLQLPANNYIVDITKPLIKHEFKIIEGFFRTNVLYSKGVPFETFNISSNNLFDINHVEVFVNNVKYEKRDCLYDMTEMGNEYVLTVGYDNTFTIMFGNNIYGRQLYSGMTIKIQWLSHTGKSGNIYTNSLTRFAWEEKGKDTFGNSVDLNKFIKLEMNNCVSGGINSDTIDIVKNMIGYNSRSLVLATEENYKLFFKRFSFIGRINCWSEENSMYIIAACLSDTITNIKNHNDYFNLDLNKLFINEEQKAQITTTLANSNRTFAGVTLKFIDPVIRQYSVIAFVKLKDNYNRESVKEQIRQILGNYFISLPDNTLTIYKSELITTVMNNISDIEAFDLKFVSALAEEAFKNSYYIKYELTVANNEFKFVPKKVFYEKDSEPGLDSFGNIQLDSKLEIPILHGGFNYYPNKTSMKESENKQTISMETIQFYFL